MTEARLLTKYIGNNVGEDCACRNCKRSRDNVRSFYLRKERKLLNDLVEFCVKSKYIEDASSMVNSDIEEGMSLVIDNIKDFIASRMRKEKYRIINEKYMFNKLNNKDMK